MESQSGMFKQQAMVSGHFRDAPGECGFISVTHAHAKARPVRLYSVCQSARAAYRLLHRPFAAQ